MQTGNARNSREAIKEKKAIESWENKNEVNDEWYTKSEVANTKKAGDPLTSQLLALNVLI